MREILFRGKRISDGKWLYGYYTDDKAHRTDFPCIHPFIIYDNEWDWRVLPETVCQYIGQKDKNEVKIFEHDIVETKYGRICEVVRVSLDTYCGWDLIPIGKYDCKAPDKWDLWNCGNLVVIGNVFDNLDLMEDKNERDNF